MARANRGNDVPHSVTSPAGVDLRSDEQRAAEASMREQYLQELQRSKYLEDHERQVEAERAQFLREQWRRSDQAALAGRAANLNPLTTAAFATSVPAAIAGAVPFANQVRRGVQENGVASTFFDKDTLFGLTMLGAVKQAGFRTNAPSWTSAGRGAKALHFHKDIATFPVRALKGTPEVLGKARDKLSGIPRALYERELAATEKAIANAKNDTVYFQKGMTRDQKLEALRTKEQTVRELESRATFYRQKILGSKKVPDSMGGEVPANTTALAPQRTVATRGQHTAGATRQYGPRSANDYLSDASRDLYGGTTPVRGAIRSYFSNFADQHPVTMNRLGWGLVIADILAAGTLGVKAYDAFSPSARRAARASADAGKMADAVQSAVNDTWHSATNRVDQLSDANMARDILRKSSQAAAYQVRMLSGGNPQAEEALARDAYSTLRGVEAKIMDSDVFRDEVARIRGTRVYALARDEADRTYMSQQNRDYDSYLEQVRRKYDQKSDLDIFMIGGDGEK